MEMCRPVFCWATISYTTVFGVKISYTPCYNLVTHKLMEEGRDHFLNIPFHNHLWDLGCRQPATTDESAAISIHAEMKLIAY